MEELVPENPSEPWDATEPWDAPPPPQLVPFTPVDPLEAAEQNAKMLQAGVLLPQFVSGACEPIVPPPFRAPSPECPSATIVLCCGAACRFRLCMLRAVVAQRE
jgi:hypothetical protein